jgi:uncharacterized protein
VSFNSRLYEGSIRHRHREPGGGELHHRLFMAYLDLDELPEVFDGHLLWSARRPAIAWFRRSDYLGDPRVPLKDAVRELVFERTGVRPAGPIRLLTHLRYFGHCFNPVSFYYCFDLSGEVVEAVVADVTNTPWGERHAYVMPVDATSDHGSVKLMRQQLSKRLHVSPFMSMDHVYDWRLTVPGEQLLVHIESHRRDSDVNVFDATLSLRGRELTPAAMRGMLLRHPFITLRVVAGIYGHALRLRLRGAQWFGHPTAKGPGGKHKTAST